MTNPPATEGNGAERAEGAATLSRLHTMLAVVVIGAFAVAFAHQHAVDNRVYYSDCAVTMTAALKLVDDGVFLPYGNPSYNFKSHNYDLHLGPFANLLMAVPLLVSRNLVLQYVFLSVLNLLALLVVANAGGRVLRGSGLDWLSPLLLGTSMLSNYPVLLPLNTSFQPFFLALFIWMLVRHAQGGRWALLGAWAAAAACAQLHFTNVLLFPTVLVGTRWSRGRVVVRDTAAGMLLALATQGYFVMEVFDAFRLGYVFGDSGVHVGLGWAAVRDLHREWFQYLDGNYGYVHVALLLFGLIRIVGLFRRHARFKSAMAAALFFVFLEIELSLFFSIVATGGEFLLNHYFYASNVFLAFWGALAADFGVAPALWKRAGALAARAGIAAWCVFSCVASIGFTPSETYYSYYRLNDQIRVAEELRTVIREHDLWNIRIRELPFDAKGQTETCGACSESYETFESLLKYVAPNEAIRLGGDNKRELIVTVFAKSIPDTADRLPVFRNRNVRDLGAVETGHFKASFHYGEDIPWCNLTR